jgi:heat shock protein HtpX
MQPDGLPQNLQASGIAGRSAWMELFSSHPPLEARIAALQNSRPRA